MSRIPLRSLTGELLLVGSSVLLFVLSFPNPLFQKGLSFLAYISMGPFFLLLRRVRFLKALLYGGICGYLSFALFNFWLTQYGLFLFAAVTTLYSLYFLVLSPLLWSAARFFPRYGFLLQTVLWIGYEFLRTQGFLGYSYGLLGYSQYRFLSLIGIVDLVGISGVSLLVVFPSIFLGWNGGGTPLPKRSFLFFSLLYIGLLGVSLGYSRLSRVDYSQSPLWKVAMIQPNIDPGDTGVETYREQSARLMELSREAQRGHPSIVIWPETAVVPSIRWHARYRRDQYRSRLVHDLLAFFASSPVPYLIGNNDSFQEGKTRYSYNAALLFEGEILKDAYHKTHLVPFSEHFPQKSLVPWLYDYLVATLKEGSSVDEEPFYRQGKTYDPLVVGDIPLGVLICFEDSFDDLPRHLISSGARVLVNLSNDAWSPSPVAALQHGAIAVFRAIENRRSLIRATTSGYTCIVDPNGTVLSSLPPNTEGYLVASAPLYEGPSTLFARWGHWFPYLLFIASIFSLLCHILLDYVATRKEKL